MDYDLWQLWFGLCFLGDYCSHIHEDVSISFRGNSDQEIITQL